MDEQRGERKNKTDFRKQNNMKKMSLSGKLF